MSDTVTTSSTTLLDTTYITHKITYRDDKKVNKLEDKNTRKIEVAEDSKGTYNPPKIVVDESNATEWEYIETKDADGNVTSCKVTETRVSNNNPAPTKIVIVKNFDSTGRMISETLLDDNRTIYKNSYSYYGSSEKIKSKTCRHDLTREYYDYDMNELLVKITSKTLASKAMCVTYEAAYDDDKNLLWKKDKEYLVITRDYDRDQNLLSETERYYDNKANGKLLATKVKSYSVINSKSKLIKVVTNRFETEHYKYNSNGDVVEMFMKDEEKELLRRISITEDAPLEDGTVNKVEEIIEYITLRSGEVINKKYRNGYQKKNATESSPSTYDYRLTYNAYDDDFSTRVTYEYDDENRRTSVTTKQTIDGTEKTFSIITYTYTTSEDGTVTTKKKVEEFYDRDNNTCVIKRDTHEEITDDSYDVEKEVYPTFTQNWTVEKYKTVTNTTTEDNTDEEETTEESDS